jgi:hypothetical protein
VNLRELLSLYIVPEFGNLMVSSESWYKNLVKHYFIINCEKEQIGTFSFKNVKNHKKYRRKYIIKRKRNNLKKRKGSKEIEKSYHVVSLLYIIGSFI